MTDTDINLWYKACRDVEVERANDIKMTTGMETQSSCIGTRINTLMLHLKSKIDAAIEIILNKNKKDNEGKDKNEKKKMTKYVQILKDYRYNCNMVSQEEIKAFQWIELSIKNQDKKVGNFEWPDTSGPIRKIGDGGNDKDKGETNETETSGDKAENNNNNKT